MAEQQEKNGSDLLYRLVSYAKDYINLVNPAISRYKIFTGDLLKETIDLELLFSEGLLNQESIQVNLPNFYQYTPKEILEQDSEVRRLYEAEKKIALKLEEISGKYKINEYTKQIVINFGFFTADYVIETVVDEDSESIIVDGEDPINEGTETKYETKTYPLFSMPIEITQNNGKYSIKVLDDRVTTNFGFLSNILLEKNYFEFIEHINVLDSEGKLSIPLMQDTLDGLWNTLKTSLRLSEAVFDDDSFSMDYSVISLSAKSNFFLSQDLAKLLSLKNADLLNTSLGAWIQGLNDIEKTNSNESDSKDIYFPFEYNSYQKDILKLLPYKASIVEGPPGTGKSQTIANLLCHLAANNKKVLFLSQKPQALKVVKDKLRELDIKYLFGYIPDRYSTIYTDQEEADSAGSLLAGVSEYLNDFNTIKPPKKVSVNDSLNNFSDYMSTEISFVSLYSKISQLEKFDIGLRNCSGFLSNFTSSTFQQIIETEQSLESAKNFCSDFVSSHSTVSVLNTVFNHIDFTQNYSKIIESIIEEVGHHFYDRSSKIGRFFINNLLLGIKLKKLTQDLPGEIHSYFEEITTKHLYKSEVLVELNVLKNYFLYKESLIKIDRLNDRLKGFFLDSDMTFSNYSRLKELVSVEGTTSTLNSILELYKAKEDLKKLFLKNPNIINKNLTEVRQCEKLNIRYYINNRIRNRVSSEFNSQVVKSVIARIARSLKKSKRAYKTFDTLKSDPKNFITVSNIIPVWIMSLEDASRLIPLENGVFDYIVLDEASQCNLAFAIPAMFRAKHILFIGDSEQMRDDTIRFKSNRTLLSIAEKNRIPDELQIKGEGDSVKSVLDIGYLAGFEKSALLNHYRSPKEIIGFSNKYFYAPKGKNLNVINSNYLTYKDTNRVLVLHTVTTNRSDDEGSKSNYQEALYIKKLIEELRRDPKTKNKSIGVLTFFNEQALLLKKTIELPDIKISIIEGIQGDERDIIIFSFVISDPSQKRKYIALTSEGGDINKSINEGRVNVAFSRARQQVHCVTSLEPERWPDGIWIKKYLEYVQREGTVNFYDEKLKPFDSLFEEEFYYFIRNKLGDSYIIQNQIESCGFKIDFVITNADSGQKLAVECDGPTHFEDEDSSIYVTSDLERQSILESAGWIFYRLPYSRWITEKDKRMQFSTEIKEIFNDLGTAEGITEEDVTLVEHSHQNDVPVQTIYQTQTKEEAVLDAQDLDVNEKTFEELFRFDIDSQRTLIVSEMPSKDGVWINEYLNKGNYVGYSSHGIGIKHTDIKSFINGSKETLKSEKESRIPWISGSHAELVVSKIPSAVYKGKFIIDLRQYISTTKYTGFTKKGIRMNEDTFQNFIETLELKLP